MGILYNQNIQLEVNETPCILIHCKNVTSETQRTESPTPSTIGSTHELVSKRPRFFPQVLGAMAASYISLATGASLAFVTATLSLLKHESSSVRVSDKQISWVASCTMLGALLGGLLSGPCMSLGRRSALWFCALPLSVAWVVLAFADNVEMFHVSHFMFGLCIGMGNDAAQLYISEMAHADNRGALGCVPVAMFNFGTMTFYFAALFDLPWHTLAWVGVGLSLPALLLPAFLPESPSFLASRSRETEALLALKKLRGSSWDAGPELIELMSLERPKLGVKARLSALKERAAIQPILMVAFIRIFSRFCGIRAIQTYTQDILLVANSSLSVELATFLTGVVQFISTLTACVIVDLKSRKFYMLTSLAVMAAALVLLAVYLTLDHSNHHGMLRLLPLLLIAFYLIANSLGLGPISGLILGELVPQRHRSLATSITGCVSWLAAFAVTKTYIIFNLLLNLHGTLFLYAAICVIGIVFICVCVPETRGKSQLEIEDLFARNKDQKTISCS